MKENRTTQLTWEFPDFPPRPIKREVIFSLMDFQGALYFVNDSEEILTSVSTESFGFVEDSSLENNPKYNYKDVKPKESVKVEQYDGYYDLDFVLGFNIYIESKKLGKIILYPPFDKGGVKAQPLLYKEGTPRFVSLKKVD